MKFRVPEIFLGTFLAVAVFAMGFLFASSYQSSPPAKHQSQQSEPGEQNVVGGKSTSKGRGDSAQNHENQEGKNEFWTAKLTDWLLAILTGLLVLFTYRLWKSTDKLWAAGEKQIAAAERSASVAERALSDIERPYLFVSNVGRLQVQEFYDFDEGEVGHDLKVTYEVANHGKIPAIVESLRANLSVFTEPLDPLEADFDHPLVGVPVIAAGENRADIKIDLGWNEFGTNESGNTVPEFGQETLFLRVIIFYRGPFSKGHETSVCLRFDDRTHRFVGFYGGEKYNYET
jgi:hypothetical protein